jgi:hypothetical protein
MFSSDASWAFAVGAVALVVTIPIAVLQPRWAGFTLLASAVLQPAVLYVLGRLAGVVEQEFPVEVMLVFYSLTVAVIGAVLILSTLSWGQKRAEAGVEPRKSISGS